jgi:hypothetical protein
MHAPVVEHDDSKTDHALYLLVFPHDPIEGWRPGGGSASFAFGGLERETSMKRMSIIAGLCSLAFVNLAQLARAEDALSLRAGFRKLPNSPK